MDYTNICEASPGRGASGDSPSASPVYRSELSRDGFRTSFGGARTLLELFQNSVEANPNRFLHGRRVVGKDGKAGAYVWETYREVSLNVATADQGLRMEGVGKGSAVCIYGANSPEWSQAMHACNRTAAICVPLYDTLGANAVKHILEHSEAQFCFVAHDKFERLAKILTSPEPHNCKVKAICVWGKSDAIDEGLKEACAAKNIKIISWCELLSQGGLINEEKYPPIAPDPEDICTIMYTSGTTGVPKGVMITHRAIVSVVSSTFAFGDNYADANIGKDEVYLSFLPLAHIYGRLLEECVLAMGGRIGYWQGDIRKLPEDIAALKPTILAGVPRVWERMHAKVMSQIKAKRIISRLIFHLAFYWKRRAMRNGTPQAKASPLLDAFIFRKIQSKLGGRLKYATNGAAPLSPQMEEFFRVCLCCSVSQGYGLTETCAITTIAVPDDYGMFGTVGPIQPCAEFRLESIPEMGYDARGPTPRGELCVRGPCLCSGYYKQEDLFKQTMDADGFFHTGDVAELRPDGSMKIIDRKKNIFKLSQGEYVAAERVETELKAPEVVEQIWVYGDSTRRYLVAIVHPSASALEAWARDNGVEGDLPELCKSSKAEAHVLSQLKVAAGAAGLMGFEKVQQVRLVPEGFTTENELMTPSFKLKRVNLRRRYQGLIDEMYATVP
eukprot:evm.model.scf_1852.2 EVM.evm.TU.scf_1852.2   scf_1852:22782-32698(+)